MVRHVRHAMIQNQRTYTINIQTAWGGGGLLFFLFMKLLYCCCLGLRSRSQFYNCLSRLKKYAVQALLVTYKSNSSTEALMHMNNHILVIHQFQLQLQHTNTSLAEYLTCTFHVSFHWISNKTNSSHSFLWADFSDKIGYPKLNWL